MRRVSTPARVSGGSACVAARACGQPGQQGPGDLNLRPPSVGRLTRARHMAGSG